MIFLDVRSAARVATSGRSGLTESEELQKWSQVLVTDTCGDRSEDDEVGRLVPLILADSPAKLRTCGKHLRHRHDDSNFQSDDIERSR